MAGASRSTSLTLDLEEVEAEAEAEVRSLFLLHGRFIDDLIYSSSLGYSGGGGGSYGKLRPAWCVDRALTKLP